MLKRSPGPEGVFNLSKGRDLTNVSELQHEISINVVFVTSKGLDQPVHMRSLIRAFASLLNILLLFCYWRASFRVFKLKRRLHIFI